MARHLMMMAWFASVLFASCVKGYDSTDRDSIPLNLTIVNMDAKQTNRSCDFNEGCRLSRLSCRYISFLNKHPIRAQYSADLDSTLQTLTSSKLDTGAIVYFNENFTDTFVAKMALGEDADDETISSSQVQVWVTEKESPTLQKYLQAAYDEFVEGLLSACGFDPERYEFKNPIKYHVI